MARGGRRVGKSKAVAAPAVTGMRQLSDAEIGRNLQRAQEAKIRRELPEIAKGNERRALKQLDGTIDMRIHPDSYHFWGQKLGYGCWKDKKFCDEYKRDVPESRVKTVSHVPTSCVALAPEENLALLFGPDGRMRRRRRAS